MTQTKREFIAAGLVLFLYCLGCSIESKYENPQIVEVRK